MIKGGSEGLRILSWSKAGAKVRALRNARSGSAIPILNRLLAVAAAPVLIALSARASEAPEPLTTVIREVKPSVVAVGTYGVLRSPSALFYGSGFVAAEGNLVVTVAHVPMAVKAKEPSESLRVFVFGEKDRPGRKATVLAQDSRTDIAILRVEGSALTWLNLGTSHGIQEGTRVAFCGYPYGALMGLFPTTNAGIISNICPAALPVERISDLKPDMFLALERPFNLFQVDGTAYPGNSGGPLFLPASGEVVGVIASTLLKKDTHGEPAPAGITFAVPIDLVKVILDAAAKGGTD